MTELEAEALSARLTRIWAPERVTLCALSKQGVLEWEAQIREHVFIAVALHLDFPEFILYHQAKHFVANLYLTCDGDIEADKGDAREKDVERRELIEQFAWEWTPFFRRGCWLSNCDLEASAHEKAQWMRGFTREEVESWKLKF